MIRAIETRYAGHHFRSRLEARWAVFFDALDVEWQYEPEGFEWPKQLSLHGEVVEAGRYLPDFFLPGLNAWFEVKGVRPTKEEGHLHWCFSQVQDKRHLCAWGPLPERLLYAHGIPQGWEGDEAVGHPRPTRGIELDGGCDEHYMWCTCSLCGKVGIEFDGRGNRICGHPEFGYYDKGYSFEDQRIVAAFAAARSARFEHGQSGAT